MKWFSYFLLLPLLILLAYIQIIVMPTIKLINGHADILLIFVIAWALQEKGLPAWFPAIVGGLIISLVSAVPLFIPLVTYLFITLFARLIRSRIWQMPILAMLTTTLVGSLLSAILTLLVLQFNGYNLPWELTMNSVILPATLLNLMLSLPVYLLVTDFGQFLAPSEEMV